MENEEFSEDILKGRWHVRELILHERLFRVLREPWNSGRDELWKMFQKVKNDSLRVGEDNIDGWMDIDKKGWTLFREQVILGKASLPNHVEVIVNKIKAELSLIANVFMSVNLLEGKGYARSKPPEAYIFHTETPNDKWYKVCLHELLHIKTGEVYWEFLPPELKGADFEEKWIKKLQHLWK